MRGSCGQNPWDFLQPSRFFEILRGLLLSLFCAQFRSYCSLKLSKFRPILWIKIASDFRGLHFLLFLFFTKFGTFLHFSRCKALGDFLISFLELDISKGCLGDISQNSSFRN